MSRGLVKSCEQRREKIKTMIIEGKSIKQIMDKLGCSESLVRQVAKLNDLNHFSSRISHEKLLRILHQLLTTKRTKYGIMRDHKISKACLEKIIKTARKAGFKI